MALKSPKPKTSKTTTSSLDINKGKTTGKANNKYGLTQKTKNAVNSVKKQYQAYQNQYNKNVDTQVSNDVASSNAQYNASAKSAALRNAVQQKELQRQMYRNGITGGASETTMMNQANNYANQQGKIASDKIGAQNKIKQQGEANKASFALSNAQARDTAVQQAKDRVYNKYQNWVNLKETQRKEKKEDKRNAREWKFKVSEANANRAERASETKYNRKQAAKSERNATYQLKVSGYNSVSTINRLIKKAKKQGKTWKIPYLIARRGEIARSKK